MEHKTLRIGFIGAGGIHFGRPGSKLPWAHATRLEKIGNIKVVAIVDTDIKLAEDVLKAKLSSDQVKHFYTDCQVFTHFKELLAQKPDAVFIGIPPIYRGSLEMDIELQFVKAGIHVFVEKSPSVVPPEEFDNYVEEVRKTSIKNNVVVSVGYMFRYHAGIDKMKELIIDHGGKVMACRAKFSLAYSRGHKGRDSYNNKITGGPIVEQATHVCDLARYLAGDINLDSVQTIMLKDSDPSGAGHLSHLPHDGENNIQPADKVPRVTFSQWRFVNGGIGTLMHTIALPGSRHEISIEVQMDGLQMSLFKPVEEDSSLVVRSIKADDPNRDTNYTFNEQDSFLNELSAFINAVRTEDHTGIRSSYEDAAKTYEFHGKLAKIS
ncbi:unnamed protein product [Mytilus edulis]|uniref:Gfo/Idh/MocA family oxidoreductase n=1 Tax=Mytilus edulis TaxID=6550 RepID=A0A8S3RFQ3_MYTED|nr:unnamed protein product [Mytilus edulis]